MASLLSQYKFLFLWALEMIQMKTLLCKIPHTWVSAVQILMKMLCTLVQKFLILVSVQYKSSWKCFVRLYKNSSYLCQCSTNPHENALYACTCSLLHSLQNSTSRLWFSRLCNHSWKGTSLPQNSAYVMKWVVMWKSVTRISTSFLLQPPYHFHGRSVHKDYINMCTIYVC